MPDQTRTRAADLIEAGPDETPVFDSETVRILEHGLEHGGEFGLSAGQLGAQPSLQRVLEHGPRTHATQALHNPVRLLVFTRHGQEEEPGEARHNTCRAVNRTQLAGDKGAMFRVGLLPERSGMSRVRGEESKDQEDAGLLLLRWLTGLASLRGEVESRRLLAVTVTGTPGSVQVAAGLSPSFSESVFKFAVIEPRGPG